MRKKVVVLCFLVFVSVFASELRIYNDKCVYYPDKPNSFVGFNPDVAVFCDNYTIPVYRGDRIDGNSPLINVYREYSLLTDKFNVVSEKRSILENAIKSAKVNGSQDLTRIFQKADFFASRLASVKKEERSIKEKIDILKKKMDKMAPSHYPYFCNLPEKFNSLYYQFKGIDTRVSNKLYFNLSSKRVKVLKQLVLKNSSGIDIKADKLYVLNIYSRRYFSPIDFRPWVVREKTYETRKMMAARAPSEEEFLGDIPSEPPAQKRAVQTESRVYFLENIVLNSDGIEKEFNVKKATVPFQSNLVVYPYTDARVYNQYKFTLPFEVDSDYWEVYVGKKTFSSVRGGFDREENVYRLFAGIDYSLQVSRKKNLNFKEETGFFNKKKVIKDGYELTFKNISDKVKELTVVDRVPVSTRKGVIVRDVAVKGIKDYRLTKRGKLTFKLKLKPGEIKKVKVNFVIEYPEDQNIFY